MHLARAQNLLRSTLALIVLLLLLSCGGGSGLGPAGSDSYQTPYGGPTESTSSSGPPSGGRGKGPQGIVRDLPPKERAAGAGPDAPETPFFENFQGRGAPPPPPSYLLLGFGSRGAGWLEAKNLPVGGAAPSFASWGRVPWDAYNAMDGSVHPATGDIDGDGRDEIVLGLGPGGRGLAYVLDDPATGLAGIGWLQFRNWPQYTSSSNAPVHPACVDIDGDGRDEIILGSDSGGWVEIFRYAGNGSFIPFANTPVAGGYLRVSWSTYNSGAAPVFPAGGNLDGAGGQELVLGLGDRGQGWAQVWTYNGTSLVPYSGAGSGGWVQVDWAGYCAQAKAPIFPACGDLDRDGRDDVVLGLGGGGAGWIRVLRSTGTSLQPFPAGWHQVPWASYCGSGDAATYPACGDLDGDGRDDLLIGLGGPGLGWAYALRGGTLTAPDWVWTRSAWNAYNTTSPAPTFPAIASGHGVVLTRIDILPPNPETPVGIPVQLSAQGTFSDGSTGDVTVSVDWGVSDSSRAQVDDHGLVRGLQTGSIQVTATSQGVTGSAPLQINGAVLQTLQITPLSPTLAKGLTLQLEATGRFSDGTTARLTDQVDWSSQSPEIAGVDETGLLTALGTGQTTLQARLGDVSDSTLLQVTGAELVSMNIEPVDPSLPDGLSLQLAVTGLFTDGTTSPLNGQVTWTCDDPAIATVSSAGLATALDPGQATLRASLGSVSTSTSLRVTDAELVSIQVTPPAPSLPDGLILQLAAEGRFTDNSTRPLTDQVTWSTSAPEVALVSGGQVLAVDPGTARIQASLGGITGGVDLTVNPAELVSLEIGPRNPTLAAGLSLSMQAVGRYTDGSTPDITTEVSWTSSDSTRAEVELTTGLVSALAEGTTTIQATLDGRTDQTELTVSEAELVSLKVTPADRSLADGLTLQYHAEGTFTDGSMVDLTEQVTWTSSQAAAVISNVPGSRGLATALEPGDTSIEASRGAIMAGTNLRITDAELVSLTVTPIDSSLPVNLSRQFTASGRFTDNSVQPLTDQVSWVSTDPTRAAVTSGGLVTGLMAGTATIEAWSGSVSGSTGLTVSNAVVVGLELRPPDPSTPAGVPIQLFADAVYSDGFRSDVTETATWVPLTNSTEVSNLPGSKGKLTDRQEGTAAYSATFGSFSEVGTVTILPAVIDRLEVYPDSVLIGKEDLVSFKTFKVYSDDRREEVSGASWISQDPTVVVVDAAGNAQGTGPGLTTVSATLDGFTGQATVRNSGLTSVSFEGCYPTLPSDDSRDLQLADLNGDGQLDLVLASQTRLGLGGGAFGDIIPHPVFSGMQFVVGDFDEDGKVDVYARGNFYQGLGDGTLRAGRLVSQLPNGSQNSLATGDLNHDGHLDIVVGTTNQNLVSVLLGLGNGDFTLGTVTPSGGGSTSIALGDFNNDSWLDAAVVNNSEGTVRTLLNGQNGNLSESQTFSVGSFPGHLVAGDVNGDLNVDLVVPGDALFVLVGNGSGSFGLTSVPSPSHLNQAFLFDLSGDGKTDVVCEQIGVSLFEQQADGSLAYRKSWAVGDSFQTRPADLDGDGRVDLVASQSKRLVLLFADTSGGLRAPRAFASQTSSADFAPTAADFNEDGCADVVVACRTSVELRFGSPGGELSAPVSLPQAATLVAAGDCNGDSHADLVTASGPTGQVSFLAGRGDGTFAAPISRTISGPEDLRLCDYNHDSARDILVTSHSGARVLTVSSTQLLLQSSFSLTINDLQRVASGDVNGDGLMDVAVDYLDFGFSRRFAIGIGLAGGGFSSSQTISFGAPGYGVALGDLNGDGASDLLFNGDNPVWTSLSTAGRFVGFSALAPSPVVLGSLEALDLNRDGFLDAVTDGTTFLGNGTGEMTYGQVCRAGLGHAVIADVNGDGRLDRVSSTFGWLAVQRGK